MNLTTTYMNLRLDSPLVVGASPLSDYTDICKRLEDAGASCVVMHSLFMEQLLRDQLEMHYEVDALADSFAESLTFFPEPDKFALGPDEYLEQIAELKRALSIPVIASLNGTAHGHWTRYAGLLEEAGADGIELNVYYLPVRLAEHPMDVEQRFIDVLDGVVGDVDVPVAVKLGYFFSSPLHMAQRLAKFGASGMVLFNRLFHPDIDIDNLGVVPAGHYSSPELLPMRLMWLAAMFGRVDASMAASGGVYTAEHVIKAVMAGADCVQMTSALLQGGSRRLAEIKAALLEWMEDNEYESIEQMRGSMSLLRCPDPEAWERSNYLRTLQTWYPPANYE